MSIVFSVVFCPTVTPAVGGVIGLIWIGLIWIGVGSAGTVGNAALSVLLCVLFSVLSSTGSSPGLEDAIGFKAAFSEEGAVPSVGGEPSLCASKDANRAASGSLPGGPAAVILEARPGGVPAAKAIGPVLMSGGILTSFMGLLLKVSAEEGKNKRQKSRPLCEARRADCTGTGSDGR